jgi:hypothetical protein
VQFDVVLTNPPFQDSVNRGRTHYKLWLEFTRTAMSRWLRPGGHLVQVTPASFGSPSSKVLAVMKAHTTRRVRFGLERFFPGVASSFADMWLTRAQDVQMWSGEAGQDSLFAEASAKPWTEVWFEAGHALRVQLDESVIYLPADVTEHGFEVHRKVMFTDRPRWLVEHDYVVCHNARRNDDPPTLSALPEPGFGIPVFHTNAATWWSSVEQEWATAKKVMWTSSGYTKPFYDAGTIGGTDFVHFIRVPSDTEGRRLERVLTSVLFQYVFATARWSGFGNDRVFRMLPVVPLDRDWTDHDLYTWFDLSPEEVAHVERFVGAGPR